MANKSLSELLESINNEISSFSKKIDILEKKQDDILSKKYDDESKDEKSKDEKSKDEKSKDEKSKDEKSKDEKSKDNDFPLTEEELKELDEFFNKE